ncbi:hypothetical protein [Halomonas halophila]
MPTRMVSLPAEPGPCSRMSEPVELPAVSEVYGGAAPQARVHS